MSSHEPIHVKIPNSGACTGGKGYSFMAWLRLEAVERAPHRAGRALFTLLCRSGGAVRGVAAAFRGAFYKAPLTVIVRCNLGRA